MKKSSIKKIKIFSSVLLFLGSITACSPKTEKIENTMGEEKVEEIVPPVTNEIVENVYETKETFQTEEELLNFIESGTSKLKEIGKSEPVTHMKDAIVHSATTLADFLLLDQPIGGKRLEELTDKGKEVVMNSLLEVDALAKEKAPDQYESIKNKLVQVKNKFKEVIIDMIGEDNYHYFGEMKDQTIEGTKEYLDKGKSYLKEKYENWRQKQ